MEIKFWPCGLLPATISNNSILTVSTTIKGKQIGTEYDLEYKYTFKYNKERYYLAAIDQVK